MRARLASSGDRRLSVGSLSAGWLVLVPSRALALSRSRALSLSLSLALSVSLAASLAASLSFSLFPPHRWALRIRIASQRGPTSAHLRAREGVAEAGRLSGAVCMVIREKFLTHRRARAADRVASECHRPRASSRSAGPHQTAGGLGDAERALRAPDQPFARLLGRPADRPAARAPPDLC